MRAPFSRCNNIFWKFFFDNPYVRCHSIFNDKEPPVIKIHAGQMKGWLFINSSSAPYPSLQHNGYPFAYDFKCEIQ